MTTFQKIPKHVFYYNCEPISQLMHGTLTEHILSIILYTRYKGQRKSTKRHRTYAK